MSDKLLALKNDIVFQELFGKPKNSEITKHLISLILEKEIYSIDLDANKRMLGEQKDSKIGRLDIRAKFNNGEDCDIELQISPFSNIDKRLLSYWAAMYRAKIEKGENYNVLKPSICILIADYKLENLKDIVEYHTVWNLRERKYNNKILSKDIEIHILEIPKIKDNEMLKDELALWLKFIENPKNEEVENFMCFCENKLYKQAKEELAYLSDDPDFHELVVSRTLFLLDQNTYKDDARNEGLAEGRAEGRAEEKVEIAKKLLKLKMPTEKIIEITGLTNEEIEKILKETNEEENNEKGNNKGESSK